MSRSLELGCCTLEQLLEPRFLTCPTSLVLYVSSVSTMGSYYPINIFFRRYHDICSSLLSQTGVVYAVEFSHRSGRDLVNMAKKRTNVIPIIEDARHPARYRMLVSMVDVIFSDVAQPDQVWYSFLGASIGLQDVTFSFIAALHLSIPSPSFSFSSVIGFIL